MFGRDKHPKRHSESSANETVVSQMFGKMNTLFQALTPKQVETEKKTAFLSGWSPMKREELRGTYLKQLGELRQLLDQDILTEQEHEEQRGDLVDAKRQLKDKKD